MIALSQGPLFNRTEQNNNSVVQGLSVRLIMVVAFPVLVLGTVLMMVMVVVLFLSFLIHFPLYPMTECDSHFPELYQFLGQNHVS